MIDGAKICQGPAPPCAPASCDGVRIMRIASSCCSCGSGDDEFVAVRGPCFLRDSSTPRLEYSQTLQGRQSIVIIRCSPLHLGRDPESLESEGDLVLQKPTTSHTRNVTRGYFCNPNFCISQSRPLKDCQRHGLVLSEFVLLQAERSGPPYVTDPLMTLDQISNY